MSAEEDISRDNACSNIATNSCLNTGDQQLPLYHCHNCELTICAACAMTQHVEKNHQCTRISLIRDRLATEMEEQLKAVKQFSVEDFGTLTSEMDEAEKRLTGDLTELRKLCTLRNQIQARSQRMLNAFDVTPENSRISLVQDTINSLSSIKDEWTELTEAWLRLQHRLSTGWLDTEGTRSTPTCVGASASSTSSQQSDELATGSAQKSPFRHSRKSASKDLDEAKDKFELNDDALSDRSREETPSSTQSGSVLGYKHGDMVWAKYGKARHWPAMVLDAQLAGVGNPSSKSVAAYWFGYNRMSEKVGLTASAVVPFETGFSEHYKANDDREWYHVGVEDALRELLSRKGKRLSEEEAEAQGITEEWLLRWAERGFPCFVPDYVQEIMDVVKSTEGKPPPRKRKK